MRFYYWKLVRALLKMSYSLWFLLASAYAAVLICAVPQMFVVLLVLGVLFGARRKFQGSGWIFGTAKWADFSAIVGCLSGRGFLCGQMQAPSIGQAIRFIFRKQFDAESAVRIFFASQKRRAMWVRLPRGVHSMVVAPAGAGKTTGLIIPFLLDCRDSVVVFDPKAELFKATSAHRQKMGQQIVLLDPFGLAGRRSDRLNPLSLVKNGDPLSLDDIFAIAQALVLRTGMESELHWSDRAEAFIAAVAAFVAVAAEGEIRNLQSVATILANKDELDAATKRMIASDAWSGILARLGGQMDMAVDKERAGILSTVSRFLKFLNTPLVIESTSSTSFDPRKLRTGKMTVYMVLPPTYLQSHAGLLRLWVSSLLRVMSEGSPQEKFLCHYVLDEAAALGPMEVIDNAITQLRGYGVRLILVYQSLGQLKKCFPQGQDQTILANMDNKIFFGINDPSTAETISGMLGEATVENWSANSGWSTSTSVDHHGHENTSKSYSGGSSVAEVSRKLLKPEEIMQLDNTTAIVFSPGMPPLQTTLVKSFDPEFQSLFRGEGKLRMVIWSVFFLVSTLGVAAGSLLLAVKMMQNH